MARTSSARQDAIETAARLFRTQGYAATGLNQVLEQSGAPKGSFYFHFPGGKEQLALEALAVFSTAIENHIRRRLEESGGDVPAFIRGLFAGLGRQLLKNNYELGCMVANFTGEQSATQSAIALAAARLQDGWIEIVADGVSPVIPSRKEALAYATAVMTSLDGARILARARRSTAFLEATAEVLIASLPKPAAGAKRRVTKKRSVAG